MGIDISIQRGFASAALRHGRESVRTTRALVEGGALAGGTDAIASLRDVLNRADASIRETVAESPELFTGHGLGQARTAITHIDEVRRLLGTEADAIDASLVPVITQHLQTTQQSLRYLRLRRSERLIEQARATGAAVPQWSLPTGRVDEAATPTPPAVLTAPAASGTTAPAAQPVSRRVTRPAGPPETTLPDVVVTGRGTSRRAHRAEGPATLPVTAAAPTPVAPTVVRTSTPSSPAPAGHESVADAPPVESITFAPIADSSAVYRALPDEQRPLALRSPEGIAKYLREQGGTQAPDASQTTPAPTAATPTKRRHRAEKPGLLDRISAWFHVDQRPKAPKHRGATPARTRETPTATPAVTPSVTPAATPTVASTATPATTPPTRRSLRLAAQAAAATPDPAPTTATPTAALPVENASPEPQLPTAPAGAEPVLEPRTTGPAPDLPRREAAQGDLPEISGTTPGPEPFLPPPSRMDRHTFDDAPPEPYLPPREQTDPKELDALIARGATAEEVLKAAGASQETLDEIVHGVVSPHQLDEGRALHPKIADLNNMKMLEMMEEQLTDDFARLTFENSQMSTQELVDDINKTRTMLQDTRTRMAQLEAARS